MNLFTNPLVNFIYTVIYFALANYTLASLAPWILLVLEIGVWLSEAYLFHSFGKNQENLKQKPQKSVSSIKNALLFSLALNAASYGTGFSLDAILPVLLIIFLILIGILIRNALKNKK